MARKPPFVADVLQGVFDQFDELAFEQREEQQHWSGSSRKTRPPSSARGSSRRRCCVAFDLLACDEPAAVEDGFGAVKAAEALEWEVVCGELQRLDLVAVLQS
jgi:hypothetical protein